MSDAWPKEAQLFQTNAGVVELLQVDADGDPYFMILDTLVYARHVETGSIATWGLYRMQPLTPAAREMLAAVRASTSRHPASPRAKGRKR